MALDKKEKNRVDAMDTSKRNEAIKRLERERLKINEEIENILRSYAKESGNRNLKDRKHKLGESPNDWNYKGVD